MIHSINHVKKRRITSPGKDSEMELEACVCKKFYLELEIVFFNKEIDHSQARSSESPKIQLMNLLLDS